MESKRFYVGNLFPDVGQDDLDKLFSKYGQVDKVEIKTKTDIDGKVMTTFAFVTVNNMADGTVADCIKQYNNLKWKKHTIKVQQAQESFLTRLQREREEAARKKNDEGDAVLEKLPTAAFEHLALAKAFNCPTKASRRLCNSTILD